MNIIIPKDEKVGYFVLDMRDALEGKEMRFDNGENSLPECVLIVPKKYLTIDENGKYKFKLLKNYFKESINKEYCADIKFALAKLVNAEISKRKEIKIIEMEKWEKIITVAAPLWKYSVQLIDIEIKNPIKALGETEKFIDVTNAGVCSYEKVFKLVPGYIEGAGVEDMVNNYQMNYRANSKNKESSIGVEI